VERARAAGVRVETTTITSRTTAPTKIRRRPKERRALEDAKVAAFVLTAGGINGAEMAQVFVAALHRMRRIAATHTRPLIAVVQRGGTVQVLLGERRGGVRR
jgi:hypothetical protein